MSKRLILCAASLIFASALPAQTLAAPMAPAVLTQDQIQAKPVDDELNLDFTLVNATGYGIASVKISPSKQESWDENVLDEELEDGDSIDISFDPSENSALWDLQITWSDESGAVYWTGLNLTEISSVTLYYDKDSGKTTAKVS